MFQQKTHAFFRALCGLIPCAVALTVFFFTDLPIAIAVYRPDTVFGIFFEIVSPSIGPSIGLFLLCALIAAPSNEPGRMVATVTEYILALVCAWIAVAQFNKYAALHLPTYGIALAAVGYMLLMLVVARKLRPNRTELQRMVISTLAMLVLVLLITEGLKSVWGRRRFWSMDALQYETQFTPWLFPQGSGEGDMFRSFPSGHTSNGCALLLITLFPRVFPRLKKAQPLLVALTVLWIPLMAFSRMTEGMHFASDVTFGFLIAYLVFTFVSSDTFARWTAPLAKRL